MTRLLPLDHPDAPKYWANETSTLPATVRAYLNGKELDREQIGMMRAYLYQWVASPVWGPSGALEILRLRTAAIETVADINHTIDVAVDLGMDPL